MTNLPMILVTDKLDMGPSGTRQYLARQDTHTSNQTFAEHCANILSHTQWQSEPSTPSLSRVQGSKFSIFESSQRQFVEKRPIAHSMTFPDSGPPSEYNKVRYHAPGNSMGSDRRIWYRPSDNCPFKWYKVKK